MVVNQQLSKWENDVNRHGMYVILAKEPSFHDWDADTYTKTKLNPQSDVLSGMISFSLLDEERLHQHVTRTETHLSVI